MTCDTSDAYLASLFNSYFYIRHIIVKLLINRVRNRALLILYVALAGGHKVGVLSGAVMNITRLQQAER